MILYRKRAPGRVQIHENPIRNQTEEISARGNNTFIQNEFDGTASVVADVYSSPHIEQPNALTSTNC